MISGSMQLPPLLVTGFIDHAARVRRDARRGAQALTEPGINQSDSGRVPGSPDCSGADPARWGGLAETLVRR